MKKIISLSLLIVLVGCEQAQSKFFFNCKIIYPESHPLVDNILVIDTKDRYLKLNEGEMIWYGFEKSDSVIKADDYYGVPSDVVHTKTTYEFDNITGSLTTKHYGYDADKDTYLSAYRHKYQCKKAEPII